MIKQEYLKIIRRRGMFITAISLATVAALGVLIVSLIVHGNDPDKYNGGKELLDAFEGFIVLVSIVMAILIGAQAGAWDFANSTFRYMAMTGRSRLELYAVRMPALIAAILTFVTPALLIAVLGSLALPVGASTAVTGHEIAAFLWKMLLFLFTYSFVALSIGALLRSSGAAIAVSLVTSYIGFTVLALLDSLDKTLGALMLPNLISRLTGGDSAISVAAAAVGLIVWLGVLLGLGALRTVKAEY